MTPPRIKKNNPDRFIVCNNLGIPIKIDQPFSRWQITSNSWNWSILIEVKIIPIKVITLTKPNKIQPNVPPIPNKEMGI